MAEGEVGAVAPVETPVAAPQATPAPDLPVDQSSAPEGESPEQPEKTYSQKEYEAAISKRLAKESKRLERVARAEAEAAFYKRQLEERTAPKQTQQPQGAPKEEDFAGRPYREYVEALTDWKLEQRLAKANEESQQKTAEANSRQQQAAKVQYVHDNIINAGQKKYPDFIKSVVGDEDSDVDGITEAMVAVATKLPNGVDVLYQLGKNDAERLRIASLSDIEQSWELRDLSTKLSAAPKPTQTPPPIVPNAAKATVEKRLQDANVDEFFAIRKKQIAAKRGR